MPSKMFCFQCQEACGNTGCTVRGMCGKKPKTAGIQDRLVKVLKDMSLSVKNEPTKETGRLITESLFMTITNANFDDEALNKQINRCIAFSAKNGIDIKDKAPLGVKSCDDPDVVSLRELITYGVKGISAYAEHACQLGFEDPEIYAFEVKALSSVAIMTSKEDLLNLVLETGKMCVKVMNLLDKANTQTYGNPQVTEVKTGVGKRPGILISGHDLRDLHDLLEQTKDEEIDVYTHGEMLPAHGYPEFKKYKNLYGNYGGSWWKQDKEFASFNGPIVMTTNCIIPVQKQYEKRIFTTGAVGYPGIKHIPDRLPNGMKDFSEVISLAKRCKPPKELENGKVITGCAHNQLFELKDAIIDSIKKGHIKKFVIMGGCDGRHDERKYFTEVASKLPKDTVILTAGCAKYRYNKMNLGTIDGIPRVVDAGQCNDSYSLAIFALKLKEEFGVSDVNQLPIAFDIAWYEQKAVTVLLALLSLGFKNVRIGPTLPAFLSPNVAKTLIDSFNLSCITTVDDDINKIME
jgi:hydroxylamine reductase